MRCRQGRRVSAAERNQLINVDPGTASTILERPVAAAGGFEAIERPQNR